MDHLDLNVMRAACERRPHSAPPFLPSPHAHPAYPRNEMEKALGTKVLLTSLHVQLPLAILVHDYYFPPPGSEAYTRHWLIKAQPLQSDPSLLAATFLSSHSSLIVIVSTFSVS